MSRVAGWAFVLLVYALLWSTMMYALPSPIVSFAVMSPTVKSSGSSWSVRNEFFNASSGMCIIHSVSDEENFRYIVSALEGRVSISMGILFTKGDDMRLRLAVDGQDIIDEPATIDGQWLVVSLAPDSFKTTLAISEMRNGKELEVFSGTGKALNVGLRGFAEAVDSNTGCFGNFENLKLWDGYGIPKVDSGP